MKNRRHRKLATDLVGIPLYYYYYCMNERKILLINLVGSKCQMIMYVHKAQIMLLIFLNIFWYIFIITI